MPVGEPEVRRGEPAFSFGETTSARSRIPDQSAPYAPAFMRTPPPAVPGIAHANSSPPRPAARARWRHTAFVAPPPARSTSPSSSIAARSPSSRRTSASTPSSAASMFEPRPTVTIPRPRSAAHASASSSSASDPGRANAVAGPPVPIVVNRASGVPDSISIGSRPFRRRRKGPRRLPGLRATARPPERHDDVARANEPERETRRIIECRRPDAPSRIGDIAEDEPRGDTFARSVPPSHEVGDDRDVGDPERRSQLTWRCRVRSTTWGTYSAISRPSVRPRAVSSAARSSVGLWP